MVRDVAIARRKTRVNALLTSPHHEEPDCFASLAMTKEVVEPHSILL